MWSNSHRTPLGVTTRSLSLSVGSFSNTMNNACPMFSLRRNLIHAWPWATVSTTMLLSAPQAVETATSYLSGIVPRLPRRPCEITYEWSEGCTGDETIHGTHRSNQSAWALLSYLGLCSGDALASSWTERAKRTSKSIPLRMPAHIHGISLHMPPISSATSAFFILKEFNSFSWTFRQHHL